ncbi:hypothetical protein B484DRAFT_30996 [Ochromonadaceae sp. CCMP2298]|nr:hypothetical protein B484DRAFT_30996 [Ochromonadaceae sp. CCMP2298]
MNCEPQQLERISQELSASLFVIRSSSLISLSFVQAYLLLTFFGPGCPLILTFPGTGRGIAGGMKSIRLLYHVKMKELNYNTHTIRFPQPRSAIICHHLTCLRPQWLKDCASSPTWDRWGTPYTVRQAGRIKPGGIQSAEPRARGGGIAVTMLDLLDRDPCSCRSLASCENRPSSAASCGTVRAQ